MTLNMFLTSVFRLSNTSSLSFLYLTVSLIIITWDRYSTCYDTILGNISINKVTTIRLLGIINNSSITNHGHIAHCTVRIAWSHSMVGTCL